MLSIMGRSVFGPFLLDIERELGLSHGAAGGLFLFIAAGYGTTMLLSGFIARRIGHRGSIIASLAALGVTLLLAAAAPTVGALRLALLLAGAAAAVYMPSGVATIYRLTPRPLWGRGIAIHELGANIAFVLAPLYAELALTLADWRRGTAGLGFASLAAAVAFAVLGPRGNQRGEPPRLGNIGVFLRDPAFWSIAVPFWLAAALGVGAYQILPVYLVSERGLERGLVNGLLGLSRLTGLPAIFVAGTLADRFSPRLLAAALVGGAGIMALLLGAGNGAALLVGVFILPLLTTAFFPVAFAALTSVGRPGLENVAVSLVIPIGYFLGGGLMPSLMGRLGEQGLFGVGFLAVGGLAIVVAAVSAFTTTDRVRAG
jgi:MFS transporter, NNP family, nitrate/nitrite transporter